MTYYDDEYDSDFESDSEFYDDDDDFDSGVPDYCETVASAVTMPAQVRNAFELNLAFTNARKRGLTVAVNYWCCGTCGHAAMNVREKITDDYVFIHNQDVERALSRDFFHISFDKIESAQVIVEELQAQGLLIKWDGTQEERPMIFLTPEAQAKYEREEKEREAFRLAELEQIKSTKDSKE